jgi:acylphosphatase
MMIRFQITVIGLNIHHCGFRTYAYELARSLNLSGMVVYTEHDLLIEVEGSAGNVNQYIEWIRVGPIESDITEFLLKEIPSAGSNKFHMVNGFLYEPNHRNIIYA